jgi:hypothetical protein
MPDEVRRPNVRRQVLMFRRIADSSPNVDSGDSGVLAEHRQLACSAAAQAQHQRDERRLAGAVRSQQAGDPATDVDVEAVERDRPAVALGDAASTHDRSVCVEQHDLIFVQRSGVASERRVRRAGAATLPLAPCDAGPRGRLRLSSHERSR